MQYNTRRKSISLQALGIQIPQTSRSHRPSLSKSSIDSADPPAKRVKREHSTDSLPINGLVLAASPVTVTKTVTFADRPLSSGRNAYEHTPPPSPGPTPSKIDLSRVNDDIVAGVIEQLEKTGNRPHLIKELASVLSTTSPDVSRYVKSRRTSKIKLTCYRSANPAALLSSRLASYMRRPWSAGSPCPVAKELIPIHPRKVFYYLTTTPRQGLPASALEPQPVVIGGGRGKTAPIRIISPSLSNASQDDEASNGEERKRAALSPSPEVELGLDLEELIYSSSPDKTPDFPTPPVNGPSSFINSSVRRQSSDSERDLRRAQSPPLEGDEQEFTATARDMRMKGLENTALSDPAIITTSDRTMDSIESDDMKPDHSEDAATLSLGQHVISVQAPKHESMLPSSPLVKATSYGRPGSSRIKEIDAGLLGDGLITSWDIRRPQSVGFDELDDLFDCY